MKKIILLALLTLAFANGYSQKKGGFRVGLDFGFVPSDGGGGAMFSLEPKYNIQDNMNIGLRIGVAAIIRDLNTDGSSSSAKVSANGSYVVTYDYYFHKSGSSFAPYIGAGVGYYSLANVEFDDTATETINPEVTGEMGALLRGGFEWGKFRMGVEYNLVPDSDLENSNGEKVGTASNTYVGIHLGFYLGGGKWGQ